VALLRRIVDALLRTARERALDAGEVAHLPPALREHVRVWGAPALDLDGEWRRAAQGWRDDAERALDERR
jgi:hypothetical protein